MPSAMPKAQMWFCWRRMSRLCFRIRRPSMRHCGRWCRSLGGASGARRGCEKVAPERSHRSHDTGTAEARRRPMEIETVGKTVFAAKIENLLDLYEVSKGTMKPEQVRQVEVPDSLVDTGAT